ncbi:MAG: YggS family pyridoxal phosphate-dependent enzyme [Candidatus Krumholzibacteria bacterium]|nr:YggS family pyridoxal phosphate-dependent enzyme [Candidatus Krumholzibacteria bacterium]MDH4337203.1 YggS family pyridoxal phosphate-dependent enzyme [Candidatus Krumholzibacteria bacterium]MDH5268666.1 YggS family pyridoxal phosphate-dependent enzyme [Candidatus Krumholzibacteria bacterium]MDH5627809.1 YggS family pyridoxal phosphate-dependent enzyme [Candidatus Krumholzibacteria bacterium]
MNSAHTHIAANVARVRERVAAAASRAGRPAEAVTIVAVTKTFGPDMVEAIARAGIGDIGENRVQELLTKLDAVREPCRWHLVGPLQRNKAGKVVGRVHLLQAIDGVRIAETVDRIAGERGVRAAVLLEVNTSGEASKHGVAPGETVAAGEALAGLAHLDFRGLMTIGPLTGGPDDTRRCFRQLHALAEETRRATGLALPELSMGMSGDFEAAIEEGATIIRVGRVITGDRPEPVG